MPLPLDDFLVEIRNAIGPEAAETCERLAFTAVEIEIFADETPSDPTDSYIGGHPYVPDAEWDWPKNEEGLPLTFLAQINWAQVPAVLPSYPTSGILQWFVDGTEDTFGKTWEEQQGNEGMALRWISKDRLGKVIHTSTDPLPYTEAHDEDPFDAYSPDGPRGPYRVSFKPGLFLPGPGETYELKRSDEEMGKYSEIIDAIYRTDKLEAKAPYAPGWSVGGRPLLIQGDPRRHPLTPNDQLILGLDSGLNVLMWGDMGTAQLFGNPEEVAAGVFDSCYWDWACS